MKTYLIQLAALAAALGSAAPCSAQFIVAPDSITFTGTAVEFFATEANLINGTGLSGSLTFDNYTTITHDPAGAGNAWVTTNPAGSGDFFPTGQTVVFDLAFPQLHRFTDFVFWGYHFGGGNGNEGRRFSLEFSTDGGANFGPPVIVQRALGAATVANAATLSLGGEFDADFVRLSVLDNHFGAIGGGDRVGLGEIRFLADIPRDPWISAAPVSGSSGGAPVVVNFPVTNKGGVTSLNVTAASFTGVDAERFTLTSSLPLVVGPGQTVNLSADFDPDGAIGNFNAALEVTSDDALLPGTTIPVSMAVAIPDAAYPASASFGPVASESGEQTFNITVGNTGTGDLNILDAFFVTTAVDPGLFDDFAVTTDFINEGAVVVPPAGEGSVAIRFDTEGLKGGLYPAELRILTDDPDTPLFTVPIVVDLAIPAGSTLVAWWPLETDGSDASGNGHDGVITGAIDFSPPGASGTTGGSAEFAGASSIDVPFDESLNPSSYTVTLWASPDTVTANFQSAITSRYDGVNAVGKTFGYIVYRAPGPNWEFWTGAGQTTSFWAVTGQAPVSAGNWVHLAVSYDHVVKVKTLYVDGVAVQTTTDIVAARNLLRDLHIGGGGDFGTDFRFDGKLDDIAIFREVLDETEINTIRTSGVTGFTGLPLPPGEPAALGITGVSIVGGNIVIAGTSGLVDGQPYHIEESTDLAVFTPVVGSTFTGGGTVPQIPVSGPRRFIRIKEGAEPAL
jgi:hypothetical protein